MLRSQEDLPMATDPPDTDSETDAGGGDNSLTPKLSVILDQVKLDLPSVDLNSSDDNSDDDVTVFQRGGPANVLMSASGRLPSDDLNKELKDQKNGGIQMKSGKTTRPSASASSCGVESTNMPLMNNFMGSASSSVLEHVETNSSVNDNVGNASGGSKFGVLEAALSNPRGGAVVDLGEVDVDVDGNENQASSEGAVFKSSQPESIQFSDGFLARVESAIISGDLGAGAVNLDDMDITENQGTSIEMRQLPWEDITFTDGFLQRVESELANRKSNVIDVEMETYDFCDFDVPFFNSANRSSLRVDDDMTPNPQTHTSQLQESQNVISRYFTEDTHTSLLDSLQNINIEELLLNDVNRQNRTDTTTVPARLSSTFMPNHPEQGEACAAPSLIQQLAELSSSQSGVDLTSVDPKSGARLKVKKLPTKKEKTKQNQQEVQDQVMADLTNVPRSSGTSTEWEKSSEPSTVYLDLRNFDAEKRRQEEGVKAVERILRTKAVVQESSSDEEEEGGASSRLLWHEQRRQMKAALAAGQKPAEITKKLNLPEKPNLRQMPTATSRLPASKPTKKDAMAVCDKDITMQQSSSKVPDRHLDKADTADMTDWKDLPPASQDESMDEELSESACASSSHLVDSDAQKQAEDEAKAQKAEKQRILLEKKRKEQQSKIRLQERLNNLRPLVSSRGRQSAADATPTIYDIEASYESCPSTLPQEMDASLEMLLLSVRLSSNGEMVAHRARNSRSVDSGAGLSASYVALLTWLLSLVPENFDFLNRHNDPKTTPKTEEGAPFQVIGLQQLFLHDQLSLFIAVCPSEEYFAKASHHSRKSAASEKSKGSASFQQVVQKFLSTNTLLSACVWLEELTPIPVKGPVRQGSMPFEYTPPLPVITTRPLATFMQVNPDPAAVKKVFQMETSFFWTTVENDETYCDLDVKDPNDLHDDIQNTMSLIYKKVYREPRSMMGILNRLPQEGLDLAGVRLLYPALSSIKPALNGTLSPKDIIEYLNRVGPATALAIRGNSARQIWLDAIGPSDPILARRTDPQSLCAMFGGSSREECLLFTPRNPTRILYELSLWFGPRVPSSGSINVGQVQRPSGAGEGNYCEEEIDLLPSKPPSTLSATTKGDIILALSPLVPVQWFGILLNLCQVQGYHLRGVRRLRLSPKKINALGIDARDTQYFLGIYEEKSHNRPTTLLLLNKENAIHHAASLVEVFMVRLTVMGLLSELLLRLQDTNVMSEMLFKYITYSNGLLTSLGGDFSRVHDVDIHTTPGYIAPQLHTNPELEQVCVLTLTGSVQMKTLGSMLDQLLRPTASSRDWFELVGIKWLPNLSNMQACELTPYEVGDKLWKQSVQSLMTRQAVVLVLRGVNAIQRLQNMFQTKTPYSMLTDSQLSLDRLLAPSVDIAFQQVRFFFSDKELFCDNESRLMLPYLPPMNRFKSGRVQPGAKHGEEGVGESIMSSMLEGPRPLTTVLIIKPDGMRHFVKVLKRISLEGYKVVGMKMKVLSRSEVKVMVENETRGNLALEELHASHLMKDISVVLCLQRENAVKRLIDMMGPVDPREARHYGNGYMRGNYGSDPVANALYCSASYRASVRDMKAFFPEGLCCSITTDLEYEEITCPAVDKMVRGKGPTVRRALLRKADTCAASDSALAFASASGAGIGVQTRTGTHISSLTQTNCLVLMPSLVFASSRTARIPPYVSILEQLLHKGCELVGLKMLWFTEEQVEAFLHVIDAGSYQMAPALMSRPCIVMAIQGDNAILTFDVLLGGSFDKESLHSKHNQSILSAKDPNMASKMLAFFFDALIPNAQVEIRTGKANARKKEKTDVKTT